MNVCIKANELELAQDVFKQVMVPSSPQSVEKLLESKSNIALSIYN